MSATEDPPSESPLTNRSPSLRRVLAGYLRLRSPYNLCVDAALVFLLSYVGQSIHRWLLVADVRQGPVEQFSMQWAINEAVQIGISMLYLAGMGIFLVACARIIADQVRPSQP